MEHRIPWPVPPRHHGIIWIDPVVQVLAHVLQARRCPGKKSSRSQRYDEQFAAAGGCTGKIRWWIRACAALLTGARSASTQEIRTYHADLRLYDSLRRMRALCRYLPVGHHA